MFSVHATPEEFKNTTVTSHFGFVLRKSRAGKSRDYRDVIVSKSSVFKMFSVHTKTQTRRFQIFSGLKSVFEKLCFRDGLVWTVSLTVLSPLKRKRVFKFHPRSVKYICRGPMRHLGARG